VASGSLPGWEAVKAAADVSDDSRLLTAVLRSTAWLNLLMVPAVVLLVRRHPAARTLRNYAIALGATTLLNAQWFVWMGDDRWDLRIGYYAWLASFLILAFGFWQLAASQATDRFN